MPATRSTTIQQREAMAHLAEEHQTYGAIGEQLQVSFWTTRKWVRRAKHGGLTALVSVLGRPPTGPLGGFDARVRYVALRLKLEHPHWGAAYIVKKMKERPLLSTLILPEATAVWRYWRSFGERLFPERHASDPLLPPAGVVHGVWQMDFKESVLVAGVGATTFTQARDEFGRATVMHRVHPAAHADQRIVKPTIADVRQDCRIAFTEWGLPDSIQTDRASLFVDADPTPFPTVLNLWWTGLGLEHRLIPRHTPERNGSVERSHRTLEERTLDHQSFDNAAQLQRQVDADWHELNTECPSRARGCDGQPPVVAHPELLIPRRPYRPEWENELFDLGRVDRYLGTFTWTRTVSQSGQARLGGHPYGLGTAWAGQTVSVHFESEGRRFVFTQVRPETKAGQRLPKLEPIRKPASGLSQAELTGLAASLAELPTRQLMFPFLLMGSFKTQPPGARLSAMPQGV
jgi:hypothetical protein